MIVTIATVCPLYPNYNNTRQGIVIALICILGGEEMGPVTTNPWLIAIINMTIVFGVLIALGVLMSLIQVVDPTKAK